MMLSSSYVVIYYSHEVQEHIMNLPHKLQSRYICLTERMLQYGPNLGLPHTQSFGDGLFELRLKGAEGIARVFFCLLINKQIMILHSFIKKTQKTPLKEIRVAKIRMKEVRNGK